MLMTPGLRKFALTAHVTVSVGLLGAIAGFLVLAIAGLGSEDAQVARSAYPAMQLLTWAVILPLAFAALATGIIQSLGTRWGLIRHYWVVIKLVLTAIATGVLLMQLDNIGYVAQAAETGLAPGELLTARISLVAHAAGGLLVLLVPMALSVYKPRGRTRYGQRRQGRAVFVR